MPMNNDPVNSSNSRLTIDHTGHPSIIASTRNSTMMVSSSKSILLLPQEIIHLIINEVAAWSQLSSSETVPNCVATLKACSLVSRSFYFEARTHLFNRVDLHFGDGDSSFSTQKRAARFVKTLAQNHVGDNLVTVIRSLTITIQVPNPNPPALISKVRLRFQGKLHRVLWRAGLVKDNVFKLLDIMARSKSLESFNLYQKPAGRFVWDVKYNPYLLRICSNPLLKSLTLSGVVDLSDTVLLSIFGSTSLREITLSNLHWHEDRANEPCDRKITTLSSLQTISRVEKLEIVNTPYIPLFQATGPLSAERASSLTVPTIAFPRLRDLVVYLPTRMSEEHDSLRELILYVASTLESLELQLQWTSRSTIYPIPLSQLKSLRNIRFKITTSLFDLDQVQLALTNLLPSESNIHVSSISIEVEVNLMQFRPYGTTYYEEFSRVFFVPSPGWELLDAVLTQPTFVDLRKVTFDYKLVHFQMEGTPIPEPQPEPTIDSQLLLPVLLALPLVEVRINVTSTFLPVMIVI